MRAFTLASEFIEPLNLGASWLARTLAVTGTIVKVLLSRTLNHLRASASTYRCVENLLSIRTVLDKVGTFALTTGCVKDLYLCAIRSRVRTLALAGLVVEFLVAWTLYSSIGTSTFAQIFIKDLR